MNETDALINHIETWTQDVLNDELKMAAWVAANKLDASGLLVDEERKRIIAEVQHEKLLDDLLGDNNPTNTITGKSATSVWMDEDWQYAHVRSKY
jgi:hypothetical protein